MPTVSHMFSVFSAWVDQVSTLAGGGGAGSVTSQEMSVSDAALSVRVDTVSNAASVLSAAVNVVSNAVSQLQSVHDVLSNRVSANSAAGGGGSVTSAEAQAVSAQAASALSQALSVLSVTDAGLSTGLNTVSNALSNETSNRVSADLVLSLAVTTVSNALSNLLSVHNVLSNRVSANSAAGGVASVTSQEMSVADAALSARIYTLSQAVSVLSVQTKYTNALVTVSAATLTNLPSLVISCGVGAYAFEAMVRFECATSGGFAFGFSAPALAAQGAGIVLQTQTGTSPGAVATSAIALSAIAAGQSAFGLVAQATINQARMARMEGYLNTSAAGTFQLMARTSVAAASMLFRGGYIRAYRIE